MIRYSTIILIALSFCLPNWVHARDKEARLKKVRFLQGGALKDQHRQKDIQDQFPAFSLLPDKRLPINRTMKIPQGAHNFLIQFGDQEGWLSDGAEFRVENDGVKLLRGEMLMLKKGGWFDTLKLSLLGYSEYFVGVSDAKTTLYVIQGKVQAGPPDRSQGKKLKASQGYETPGGFSGLREVQIPDQEIQRILRWRGELRIPLGGWARFGRSVKKNWWMFLVGAGACVAVEEFNRNDGSGMESPVR